ncbi:protein of unknown function [Hyphomicrobium sp. 1Nfss2.1]
MIPDAVVEAGELHVGVEQQLAVRDQRGVEKGEIRGIGENCLMNDRIIGERAVGPDPDALGGRLLLASEITRQVGGAHLDGALAAPVATHGWRQCIDVLVDDVLGVGKGLRWGQIGHRGLVLETRLGLVKRAAHREDGAAVLNRLNPPGGEAAAVADALDIVEDWTRGIAGEQEVAVQGVHQPAGLYGACRGHQRLPEHLPPEDTLPALYAARAEEEVVLDGFEVERPEEVVERALRRRVIVRHGASLESSDGGGCRDAGVG